MHIQNKKAMEAWAKEFAQGLQVGDVVLLEGPLGAGKTQLVQWICAFFHVKEPVTSPSFALVNHYQASDFAIYHLDLYRLETAEEIETLDFETYFYPEEAITLIEWPSRAEDYLPEGAIHVEITPLFGAASEEREVKVWR